MQLEKEKQLYRELINAKDPMKLLNEYSKKYENKNLWAK